METAAIITSRWNSTRLHGKALKEIDGRPTIQWCVDRVKEASIRPIVATTENSQPIIDYCQSHGIDCFVSRYGAIEEENLILRMIQCGDAFNLDTVVRIWADNPFLSPILFTKALADFNSTKCDYWDLLDWAHGQRFAIYNHHSFSKLYHLMGEEDKWLWNYVDEVKPWKKYGFNTLIRAYSITIENDRVKGMNLNTPDDLEAARDLVKQYGRNVTYFMLKGVEENELSFL